MTRTLLTGFGAGAAAALLYASMISGLGISILLVCLAPLPVMIVALGWNHWAGLFAAAVGAVLLAIADPYLALAFLVFAGLPGWILGYLALLGRPVGANGRAPHMEWYPPGRLLLWSAVFGAAALALILVITAGDEASLRQQLRALAELILRPDDTPGAPPLPPEWSAIDPDLAVTVTMRGGLPASAVLASFTLLVDLWLAGHVVRVSQRLPRPWPELADATLPPLAAVLFAAAIAGAALLPDLAGVAAILLAATLSTAFAVAGFGLLHTMTRGKDGRIFILGSAYVAVVLLGLPIVIMTAAGVADTVFGLRRFIKRDPGPPPKSQG